MDTVHEPEHRRGESPWYSLAWLLVCVVVGWGTYTVIASAPGAFPPDRRDPNAPEMPTGSSIAATELMIRENDPATGAVVWELLVPEGEGGIAGKTTLEHPQLTLYPGPTEFVIRASRGELAEAPNGTLHSGENAALTLEGPITGASTDGTQEFAASTARWDGAAQRLELEGSPIILTREGITMKGDTLVVDFRADGHHAYKLSGNVTVTGPLQ